ncbi:glycosyltransferase family 9 protein [Roseomonas sp. SSH11]|uniref:Glycosyltransferase family 9 protein n=1 Tax=Pararoseomonas baculiformis TaxID=2820812 RepID=A0ABS4ACH8_9PROT|nr:glycosyltransferase family 9 protein [Pararoseomonas baculiformis]MBP0444250.1 glycosyltransferase family 9 protein [Pararoseomonas baculiformis]
MRILFVTSTRIGDAVLSTGLLDHLLRTHPGARITVACGPAAEGVFARMPGRERTIVVTKKPLSRHWLGLWAEVATTFWDLVVDLRGSALGYLVPARRRVVMRGGRRPGHRIGHIAGVLRLDPPPHPVAWFAPEDSARVDALLSDDRPLLLLGPTANWGGKVWPAERFVALARALAAPGAALAGARPVLLGGPGEAERAMAMPVVEAMPEALDLVGRLSLPEAAALLARGRLFVGNDSGLMHLSAATGAPTLGLFGPTPAGEYAPVGRAAQAVVAADGTMEGLGVGQALEAARALLPAPVSA